MPREDTAHNCNGRPFRIEAPRAGDAIGRALRDVYERDLGLPDDMATMLRRLNSANLRDRA